MTVTGESTLASESRAGARGVHPIARLVHVAVRTEDPWRLLDAAAAELGRPLGLVGDAGEPLGHAPAGARGRKALTVARSAATTHLLPGRRWTIVPVGAPPARLGVLAVGPADAAGSAPEPLLGPLAELLAEQLRRRALVRAQAATFLRRLIAEPCLDPDRARRDAASLGLALADAYLPALVAWRGPRPRLPVLEGLERQARSLARDGIAATLDGRLVLLHPGEAAAAMEWFERVVRRAREAAPAVAAHAIAADAAVPVCEVSAEVARLSRLWRFGPRTGDRDAVAPARQYALYGLLRDSLADGDVQRFVRERLGPVIDWDRAHGTSLAHVLEAALDHRHHEDAASRCFMHRNTFRHRLRQATELLEDDLSHPDVRLAVHVALKLRHAVDAETGQAAADGSGVRRAVGAP